MTNWLKRLLGSGSSSDASNEPATAPEPPTMPSDPPADSGMGEEDSSESSGDESA
jgi:hypothetical protein